MQELKKIYAHFDIEADGPSPNKNNMISIGVVFTDDKEGHELDSFLGDLAILPGHIEDSATLEEFWSKHSQEYSRIKNAQQPAKDVMITLSNKIASFGENINIRWVANPAAYDWQWLKYYCEEFKNDLAFDPGYSAFCMSALTHIFRRLKNITNEEFEALKEQWTEQKDGLTHNSLEDARYQAKVYHQIIKELKI